MTFIIINHLHNQIQFIKKKVAFLAVAVLEWLPCHVAFLECGRVAMTKLGGIYLPLIFR